MTDLCLRSLIHSHLQHPPLLLRNLLPLQRRRASLFPAFRLLAVLALLPQPLYLLDRWRPRCNTEKHPRSVCASRSSVLQPAPRLNLLLLRSGIRGLSNWIPHQPRRDDKLRILPVQLRRRLHAHS